MVKLCPHQLLSGYAFLVNSSCVLISRINKIMAEKGTIYVQKFKQTPHVAICIFSWHLYMKTFWSSFAQFDMKLISMQKIESPST